MKIAISAESTIDLPEEMLKEYDIHEVNGLCLKEKVDLIFSYNEAK